MTQTHEALFEVAQRFVGKVKELPGAQHDPFIQWALSLCGFGPDAPDETPWCSATMNALCFICGAPRTRSAAARSWLGIGSSVTVADAQRGDIVIVKQADNDPGPEVLNFRGHVGLFAGADAAHVYILGGNQSNSISVATFPLSRLLSIRRLM